MMVSMYCVKCRAKRDIDTDNDAHKFEEVTMKNGKPASKAVCPVCGTSLYKIGAVKK